MDLQKKLADNLLFNYTLKEICFNHNPQKHIELAKILERNQVIFLKSKKLFGEDRGSLLGQKLKEIHLQMEDKMGFQQEDIKKTMEFIIQEIMKSTQINLDILIEKINEGLRPLNDIQKNILKTIFENVFKDNERLQEEMPQEIPQEERQEVGSPPLRLGRKRMLQEEDSLLIPQEEDSLLIPQRRLFSRANSKLAGGDGAGVRLGVSRESVRTSKEARVIADGSMGDFAGAGRDGAGVRLGVSRESVRTSKEARVIADGSMEDFAEAGGDGAGAGGDGAGGDGAGAGGDGAGVRLVAREDRGQRLAGRTRRQEQC
jgi:hypothetical protein